MKQGGELSGGARDDDCIEAKQESTKCTYGGTPQKMRGYLHSAVSALTFEAPWGNRAVSNPTRIKLWGGIVPP